MSHVACYQKLVTCYMLHVTVVTHKVHPYIFRLGQTTNWKSRWFSLKNYQEFLREDILLKEWLAKKLKTSHVSDIEIERSVNILNIIIKTARPGILIGRGGEGSQKLKKEIEKKLIDIWKRIPVLKKRPLPKREIKLTIEDIKSPNTNAAVVAQSIADDLEKRIPFRRAMKQVLERVSSQKEVKGVKISSSLTEFLEDGLGQGWSLSTIAKSDNGIVVTVTGVGETAGWSGGNVERNVEIVVYRQRTNGGSFPRIG